MSGDRTEEQMADDLGRCRLARTPYLVIPRLALEAMPTWWQAEMERLLSIAEDAGMETPEYHVFRDDGKGGEYTRARTVNWETGFVRLCRGKEDPWADYKYGSVAELSPNFDVAKVEAAR